MANWRQVQRLKRGVKSWNTWRNRHLNVRTDLSNAKLSHTDLRGFNLSHTDLERVKLIEANLNEAKLMGANLHKADLTGAKLMGTNLRLAHLVSAKLYLANLSEADLSGADLSDADLSHADLSGAHLVKTDLFHHLVNTNLSHAHLDRAHLVSADLRSANLWDADLSGADLSGADLSDADLSHADLSGADLSGADLSGADLRRAYLRDTGLIGTNLSKARFSSTTLLSIDFRTTKGLAEIIHQGPSAIHLPSIQLPQDGSALHFLQGAGLTDEQIDAWRSAMIYPIQYHSVFISYSSKDEVLAHRLHADLQAHGVRCWFAPEDMKIGDKFRARIDEAIHLQDKLLLLLSEHALASLWVEDEVEAALEKEQRQQREVLFPIRLDESVVQTSQAWAAKLRRSRHIGDFTRWTDPQAYQRAFDRLLRDLKAEP